MIRVVGGSVVMDLMNGNAEEEHINPNVNCLEGRCCPECRSYGPFEILVSKRVLLYDNGTDDAVDGTTEYGEDAPTTCRACGYEGKFQDFDDVG